MASLGGFNWPILHGLCTYGVTGWILGEKILGNDTEKFDEFICWFTSHVFPGETI
jgi:multifunctional beta-oxidation protein